MLMRLDLALITEAAGLMVAVAVVAVVAGEEAGLAEEDREDIRLPVRSFLL